MLNHFLPAIKNNETGVFMAHVLIAGQQYAISSTSAEAVSYLHDIVYPSGNSGICFTNGSTKGKYVDVEVQVLPEKELNGIMDEIKKRAVYLAQCKQQVDGVYKKYALGTQLIYICEIDDDGTPNIIIYAGSIIRMASAQGNCDYKLLGRICREIAYRKLEDSGYVSVHASCVQLNGKGILIVGDSAAGKTTLALSLCRYSGAAFMSNDKVLLKLESDNLKAISFASAIRLNYGTLVSIGMESCYDSWQLKIEKPAISTDWKEFNGEKKLNILPIETKDILGFDVVASCNIHTVVYPNISREGGCYAIHRHHKPEVLEKNICTPYDPQFPEDWLTIRKQDNAALKQNASDIAADIYKRPGLTAAFSFEYLNRLLHDITDLL